MPERIIRSTKTSLKEFIEESFIWKDMEEELEAWEESVRKGYDFAENMEEVGKVRGRLEALEYFRLLPHVIIEALEDADKEKSNRELFTDEPSE